MHQSTEIVLEFYEHGPHVSVKWGSFSDKILQSVAFSQDSDQRMGEPFAPVCVAASRVIYHFVVQSALAPHCCVSKQFKDWD